MVLSYEQDMAVKAKESKVVVVAGAGSGKSTVLTGRVRHLLSIGEEPSQIYAITFTNNAAQEMRDRLADVAGIESVFIGTIHSLANRILIKNGIKTADAIESQDFNKLFYLIKNSEVMLPPVHHLLIDEFQDISKEFYEFYFYDLRPDNFFAAGDGRQAIYSFNGGSLEWMNKTIDGYGTKVYELNDCYRCPQNILNFANKFISGDPDVYFTDTTSMVEDQGTILTKPYSEENLVKNIKMVGDFKNWFVLCRTNQQVSDTLDLLCDEGIPAETFKKADNSLEDLAKKMNNDTVKVLTIHSAKGLEAEHVAVIGAKNFNAEEKRLCYVAATRAKRDLIWYKAYKVQKVYRNSGFGSANYDDSRLAFGGVVSVSNNYEGRAIIKVKLDRQKEGIMFNDF